MSVDAAAAPVRQEESGSQPADQGPPRSVLARATTVWAWTWPKLLAIGIVIGIWQFLYVIEWRPPFVFPSPSTVFSTLWDMMQTQQFWESVATTLRRAATGYMTALIIGTVVGIAVSRVRTLRLGVGSLITGLQTMPSIVWFPFAILVFAGSEKAIYFVVVLGAAPSIANGIISGIDHVPPSFVRLGRVMGANGFSLYRHVIIPAAMPTYVAGLSQGWAFAWRSLMAGELLVLVLGVHSIGATLEFGRQLSQMNVVMAMMIVILVIGMLADTVFSSLSRNLRRRRGLAIDD
ncbi:MAG TPA: ABC transporter permease [Actinomycetes bacterium]|nr:ABC transporter permease [Actinomycetes bacterium]